MVNHDGFGPYCNELLNSLLGIYTTILEMEVAEDNMKLYKNESPLLKYRSLS